VIAEMDQLLVIGRRRSAKELLVSLQSLGVVMIDPLEVAPLTRYRLEPGDQQLKALWDEVAIKTTNLLETLPDTPKATGRVELTGKPEALLAYVRNLSQQVERLLAERAELSDELEVIATYLPLFRSLAPSLAQLESSRYLTGVAFMLAPEALARVKAALDEALDQGVVLSSRPYGKSLLVIAVAHKKDRLTLLSTLSRLGLSELRLPERYEAFGVAKAVHVMEERFLAQPKRREAVEAELLELSQQHRAKLAALQQLALNHQARYEVLQELAEGRYSFALKGWLPSAERPRVVEALKRQFGDSLIIETRKADEHHDQDVPVKLENSPWVKPFELLLSLFAPPKYGYFDPSWTLAVFFPLLFGIIVGDFGFGLMFLALGIWLRRRGLAGKALSLGPLNITFPASVLPAMGSIVNWAAVWTIIWGVIYGEFFGNLLERFPPGNPVFYPTYSDKYSGMIPIAIFRVHESGFGIVLLLCIAFGALQVLGGWAIRAYYGYKHHDRKHLWEGIGMFSGLLGVIIFAAAFLNDALTTPIQVLVALLLTVFVVGVIRSGVALMPVELISNSGNILSFLRIFAVGLAAALIATLVTDLGYAIGSSLPIIGPLLGITLAFIIHLLALVIKIISYTLQPLRLQYVEFFTKFGFYEETGRPYKPFRLIGGKA
jgi:V/A-type H+-transporting ATPase subunit I